MLRLYSNISFRINVFSNINEFIEDSIYNFKKINFKKIKDDLKIIFVIWDLNTKLKTH